jgi:alpha-1,2-mannosyltransferase
MLAGMRFGALSDTYGLRLLYQPRILRLALLVILGGVVLVRVAQLLVLSQEIQWGYDLSAYWHAARQLLDGDSVYSSFQLAGTYSPQQQYLYVYPPFLAMVMMPLAAVFDDYRSANWVWAGIGTLVLIAAVALIARRERVAAGVDRWFLVAAAFVFPPVVGELIIGNVHLVILGLVTGAWLALRQGTARGEVAAGAFVGVAALVKVFPGLLILWFLLTGRRRAAVAAFVTMAALTIATLPITGPGPWLDYPVVLLNLGPPTELADVLAPSVWLSSVLPATIARIVVTVAGLATVVWASRRTLEPVGFSVAVATSVLIAPALYPHYLAIMVLPLLLAIRYAPPPAWVAVAYLMMFSFEIEALGDAAWIGSRALPTIGALFVVVGLVRFGRNRPTDGEQPPVVAATTL